MNLSRHPLTKVPDITLFFWVIKILTTALGESTSDFFVSAINPEVAVALGAVAFVLVLVLQFRAQRYNPWIYWFTVAMVAVFGTMAADVLHIGFSIPYVYSTLFFAMALAVIFWLWHTVEKNLSIHSIYTKRKEIFYWLTVITTFALGTAAGDMTASTFGWGYLLSGIIFAVLIALVALAHFIVKDSYRQTHNAVLAFWIAYILTRPLGASFADWMGKAKSFGGLGWGDGTVSLMLAVIITCLVAYLAYSHRDVEHEIR